MKTKSKAGEIVGQVIAYGFVLVLFFCICAVLLVGTWRFIGWAFGH